MGGKATRGARHSGQGHRYGRNGVEHPQGEAQRRGGCRGSRRDQQGAPATPLDREAVTNSAAARAATISPSIDGPKRQRPKPEGIRPIGWGWVEAMSARSRQARRPPSPALLSDDMNLSDIGAVAPQPVDRTAPASFRKLNRPAPAPSLAIAGALGRNVEMEQG